MGDDDDDEHQLNIDHSKEQNITLFEENNNDQTTSDDEQVSWYISIEVACSRERQLRLILSSNCPIIDCLTYLSNDDLGRTENEIMII